MSGQPGSSSTPPGTPSVTATWPPSSARAAGPNGTPEPESGPATAAHPPAAPPGILPVTRPVPLHVRHSLSQAYGPSAPSPVAVITPLPPQSLHSRLIKDRLTCPPSGEYTPGLPIPPGPRPAGGSRVCPAPTATAPATPAAPATAAATPTRWTPPSWTWSAPPAPSQTGSPPTAPATGPSAPPTPPTPAPPSTSPSTT